MLPNAASTTPGSAGQPRGEVLKQPTDASIRTTRLGEFLDWLARERDLHFDDYGSLWQWSVDDLSGFWGAVWSFLRPVSSGSPEPVVQKCAMPGASWFPNVSINWAEVALSGPNDDVVMIARSQTRDDEQWTRGELRVAVARARTGLTRLGVGRGDRVAAYVPNIPEAVVALLATASLGAIWASCAPEMGVRSVIDRFAQIEPTVLIAIDGYRYGSKDIERDAEVEQMRYALPTLRGTVRIDYLHPGRTSGCTWNDLVKSTEASPELTFDRVPFDHPLWILFSSGTTGLPKAIVHGHGGIVAELAKSHTLQSDLGPADRYFVYCTTTWVMWNILVSGLLVGAAIVLMDGNPAYPDDLELWRIIDDVGATVFGCGASLLAAGQKAGKKPGREFNLSRLKGILSTGSPLAASGFRWVYESVTPDVMLQSGSGGTDVCTGFVGGSPMLPVRAGEIAGRCLGVLAQALDPDGVPVTGVPGELVISAPMPSMPVRFWNDPDGERYRATYFMQYPGRWRHGDWIIFGEDGSSRIIGRSDGTLNRSGVRLGTADYYAVLENSDTFPEIADSLVVHIEDPNGGAGLLHLFVALRSGRHLDAALRGRIQTALTTELSPRHRPDEISEIPAVPYSLTGKKLEIPVKRILQGTPREHVVSDGAMRDPRAIEAFVHLATATHGFPGSDSEPQRRGRSTPGHR